jgi:hypothetical protein
MANALYAKGKQRTLGALVNWETSTIRAVLVRNDYAQNLATDEFYSTISAHVVGTPQTLTNKTITNGVFDADDVLFPAVASGSTCEGVVLYVDTGNPATSPLLAYIDTITGFPLATSGGDVLIQWDNGAFKIFTL